MLTAIEAGISDQRYALIRLAGSVAESGADGGAVPGEAAWGGHTPISQVRAESPAGAAAPAPGLPAGGRYRDIERKLGIVLDCLLADHLASMARAGKEGGELDERAYERLTESLNELKLERLRSRHEGESEDNHHGVDRVPPEEDNK